MPGSSRTHLRKLASGLMALTALAGCDSANPIAPDSVDEITFQIIELVIGGGAVAESGDLLTMNYDAWLHAPEGMDNKGQKVDFGDNVSFVLGSDNVIQGWNMGFEGMQAGGLRRLLIPPSLAFGANGSGVFPPNTAVVYEIELVEVEKLATRIIPFAVTDLVIGTGAEATNGRTVIISYDGFLHDDDSPDSKGLLVDSSRAEVFVLGAGEVIDAFDQGVPGMRVGGVRRIETPPDLAFGDTQVGAIPPSSSLVYDVTLLGAVD
jgi:FKBP-type peptidyl-prolyl cis-trans isomerase